MTGKTKQRVTFRSAWGAWLLVNQILPNPDPVLRKRGAGIGVYRDLLSDPHVAACLRSRKAGVLMNEWELVQGDCPNGLFGAVSEWFEALDLRQLLDNVLDVVFWGYQPVELTWRYGDGLWLPEAVVPKPPEWFIYHVDAEGLPELRFLSKDQPLTGEPAGDRYRMLCPRVSPSFDNPYGQGVAGLCFWPVVFKKAGIEFWTNFTERFGQPWVVGTSETPTDEDRFLEQLQGLVQDAVVALSKGKSVELLSEGGKQASAEVFERYCRFMDAGISKAILSQTLTTELPASGGSYAAVQGHLTVRSEVVEGDAWLARSFLNDVLGLIPLRNGFRVPAPRARIFEEDAIHLERAKRDRMLADIFGRSGAASFTLDYFQRAYHFEPGDLAAPGSAPDATPGAVPSGTA